MVSARVVLITGAASGIGAATARAFAARGERLVLADVDPEALGAIDAELASSGSADRLAITVDIRDVAGVDAMIKEAIGRFGSLDIVHANAGICPPERPLTATSPAIVDKILSVNVTGTINTLRAAVPAISDGGSVVITASVSGLIALPGAAVYAASKIALIGLGRSLAAELAPRRIRVNMVCPGGVDTPLTRGVYGAEIDHEIEAYAAINPLGRIATPEDIARAVLFLADAEHVTGISLRVDGGDGLMGVL